MKLFGAAQESLYVGAHGEPTGERAMKWFLAVNSTTVLCAAVVENGMNWIALCVAPFLICALLRRNYDQSFVGAERFWTWAVCAYTFATAVGIRSAGVSYWLPIFMVYFASGILVARAAAPLTDRAIAQELCLGFSIVLINCILTNHIVFGALLIPYVFSLMGALLFFQVRKSARRAHHEGALRETVAVNRVSILRICKWTIGVLCVTVVAFIAFPRPFVFFPGLRVGVAPLGGTGELQRHIGYRDASSTAGLRRVAFAVTFHEGKPPATPYWRGRVLAQYDGAKWFTESPPKGRPTTQAAGRAKVLSYSLFPYRLQSNLLYACGAPLNAAGQGGRPLLINSLGEVIVDTPFLASTSYKLRTALAPLPAEEPLDPIYLDAGAVSTRIARLAKDWSAGQRSPKDKAVALMAGLRRGFKYQRDTPPPPESVDPLEHFLFTTRKGNCEYFAGALGVMLRAVGVPCRLADGFMGMEKSLLGQNYLVRFSNAHAWVEAALGDGNWTPLDPTPAVTVPLGHETLQFLTDLYDEAHYQWIKGVAGFDKTDQAAVRQFFGNILAPSSVEKAAHTLASRRDVAALGGVILILLGILALSRMRNAGTSGVADMYVRTMRKVRKLCGLEGGPPWHEENRREIIERFPELAEPMDAYMDQYLAARFGGASAKPIPKIPATKALMEAAKRATRARSASISPN
jgi:transglutaminase-like putative cysteine protease